MSNRRLLEAISKSCRTATTLFFAAVLTLIGVSLQQVYAVVVKPLLTASRLPEPFEVATLIAATIPVMFLTVYSCLALVVCGRRLWKLLRH